MLSKTERKIMDYIYTKCKSKGAALLTPKEILASLLPKTELTTKELDQIMKNLVIDGYIDLEKGDKNGSLTYILSLKTRGQAYQRERKNEKQQILKSFGFKFALAIFGAIVAFLAGVILSNLAK
ncbi:MAG: hypothetical protein LBM01_01595 [Christensenellaceae bacterium]|jgi:DNA-binding MarR family transcriptional regulator|nr:hypothetical protein [Christensenellaceae bacterium]